MKRFAAALALLAPLAAGAAIITESNYVWCMTPEWARFTSLPGIPSQYIPWGTYTGGTGGTEYRRLTKYLYGTVISVVDGAFEREYPGSEAGENGGRYYPAIYETEPNTTRIVDWLDDSTIWSSGADKYLARNDYGEHYYGNGVYVTEYEHVGIAAGYGGRRLEAIVSAADPPISTEWSSAIPFDPADIAGWKNVWPTYAAVGNDPYLWPSQSVLRVYSSYGLEKYWRVAGGWSQPNHLVEIYGDDVYDAADRLFWGFTDGVYQGQGVDDVPLDCSMLDVLGYDTGWGNSASNVYSRWGNRALRLDWTRLGLLCQMLRQMEITYYVPGQEDLLPFFSASGRDYKSWEASLEVTLPQPTQVGETNSVSVAGLSWSSKTNSNTTTTNRIGWCFPTCRTPSPQVTAAVVVGDMMPLGGSANVDLDIFASLVKECVDAAGVADGGYSFDSFPVVTANGLSIGYSISMMWLMGTDTKTTGASSTYSIPATLEVTNATVTAVRSVAKSAQAYFTFALNDLYSETYANFDHTPSSNAWSSIVRQWRPTMDLMLSAYGASAYSLAADSGTDNPMKWDEISAASYSTERLFRMNPSAAEVTTVGASDRNRWNMLGSLSAATKTKCVALGGFAPSFTHLTDLTGSEISTAIGELEDAEFPATYIVTPDNEIQVISGGLMVENGEATNILWTISWTTNSVTHSLSADSKISVGSFGWKLGEPQTYASTNDVSVRVDGHQNPMVKTLWRFKNLRDPNL